MSPFHHDVKDCRYGLVMHGQGGHTCERLDSFEALAAGANAVRRGRGLGRVGLGWFVTDEFSRRKIEVEIVQADGKTVLVMHLLAGAETPADLVAAIAAAQLPERPRRGRPATCRAA